MNTKLSKNSTPNDIRQYFQVIFDLHKSGDPFPINLDDVWPLIYSSRSKALTSLKDNFIEDEDFNLYQMGKVVKINELRNGIKADTRLSVKCVEYYIARKVRSIFEVYRQVFHDTINTKQLSPAETLLRSVQLMVEQEKRMTQIEQTVNTVKSQVQEISNIKEEMEDLKSKALTSPMEFFTIVGYGCKRHVTVDLKLAAHLGRKATNLCKTMGYVCGEIPDPRFGKVKTYHQDVLKVVFDEYSNNAA